MSAEKLAQLQKLTEEFSEELGAEMDYLYHQGITFGEGRVFEFLKTAVAPEFQAVLKERYQKWVHQTRGLSDAKEDEAHVS